ncbi:MAG: glycoside hydrolase family 95 protein, partial [Aliiglaciecola sp.]|uniref:glycoside hydrolase family 95 protein n=1 Tax=Aliiglaciecola sp. TaxID=1872441 RepID=UPI0032980E85
MKNTKFTILLLGVCLLFTCKGNDRATDVVSKDLMLWYTEPATEWTQATPIGNGRLGAMVYGGVEQEHLQMNEETLWSGGPHSYDNPDAYQHLTLVRELLKQGKYVEAQATADKMLGIPQYQMAYQPLGDLFLKFFHDEKSSNYRRELDLQNAISTVTYTIDGAHFKRTVFASQPDQAIIIRLECDKPEMISFDLSMTSEHLYTSMMNTGSQLLVTGKVAPRERKGLTGPWSGEGTKFAAQTKVEADGGTVLAQGGEISVKNANAVTLVYVAATSFINYLDVSGDPSAKVNNYLSATDGKSFEQLRQRHIDDYTNLFGRVSIDLGGDTSEQNISTDKRLNRVAEGGSDKLLTEQVFQYGRYLMISGSREGTQPLNLQGIWNNKITPPWSSKYTININIEMNYWVAEVCNLSELHEPLLRMTEELQTPGRNTAKIHYKANGWLAHHNTDLWRGTAPVDGSQWGMWPTGGAWLCQHIWEHYLFTKDTEFLKKSYPILKGAAEFFLDVLVEDKNGNLITSPSISPEHSHGGEMKDGLSDGRNGPSIIAGPTMDLEILRDLFANCIAASEMLNVDEDFRLNVAKTRERLAPLKIGKHGQLQEWPEDWDNP